MSTAPEPLPPGSVLGDRFEIERLIGRGGFGLAYLAKDRLRNDEVVVKELAPEGSARRADGQLDLETLGPAAAHRVRRCFLDEAALLARLNIVGVVNVRTYGAEAGSAYYVTDFCADATPLDEVLRQSGRLSADGALDIGFQLMETLDAVHKRGILHRDIKPANVLLRQNGQVILIDFGAAREWHADMTERHTVLFTPGYAPLEQLSERARRGPATDVYGLAALLYALLAGVPPTSAADRLNGIPLQPLRQIRPDVDQVVADAIENGLALQYVDRPQTAMEFRQLFEPPEPHEQLPRLKQLDAKLRALHRLSFGRRQCPACSSILRVASPLPLHKCPVCARGTVKPRPIHAVVCPACRVGILRKVANVSPLAICPLCDIGSLTRHKPKLLGKDVKFTCANCDAEFGQHGAQVTLTRGGFRADLLETARSWPQWAELSKRSTEIQRCDGCDAQFDALKDGQWLQVAPTPEVGNPTRLYPEEWARIAAGLNPSCGSHACTACEADYFVDGDRVTLLDAHEDPFHFAETNIGRPLSWEALRWLGVGKSSERRGPACPNCGTEFDTEGAYLRLIRTNQRPLSHFLGTIQTFEDWQRIARELPRVDEEGAFEDGLDEAMLEAYIGGDLNFDDNGTIWKGPATRLRDNATGSLAISGDEVSFGSLLRRDRTPLELLATVEAHNGSLALRWRGSHEPTEYELEEVDLLVHLDSGQRIARLDASDLALRLRRAIGSRTVPD